MCKNETSKTQGDLANRLVDVLAEMTAETGCKIHIVSTQPGSMCDKDNGVVEFRFLGRSFAEELLKSMLSKAEVDQSLNTADICDEEQVDFSANGSFNFGDVTVLVEKHKDGRRLSMSRKRD